MRPLHPTGIRPSVGHQRHQRFQRRPGGRASSATPRSATGWGWWVHQLATALGVALLAVFLLAVAPTVSQALPGSSAVSVRPVALADAPLGHDNSTAPHDWTHGDPNVGDAPGNGVARNGYYYLKMRAAGTATWCEVYTGGDWLIQVEDGHKTVLAQTRTHTTGGRAFITTARPGALYLCRISDIGDEALKDYAEFNSGDPGDVTTSDCGGPGIVLDPNFNAPPMEPAPAPGMPRNGCADPTTVPYHTGDPRLSPPQELSVDLGPLHPGGVSTITTQRACDLTSFAFFGHQGRAARIVITTPSGQVINGPKWGAQTPNPNTENQEYVGADAGVVGPGTYVIHYTGPTNNKDLWAICV